VHEHVLAAVIRLDKSVALLGVEELYGPYRHLSLPRFLLIVCPTIIAGAGASVFGVVLIAGQKPESENKPPKNRSRERNRPKSANRVKLNRPAK
jgi:hypothetical protein